jgi:hypothetical protein
MILNVVETIILKVVVVAVVVADIKLLSQKVPGQMEEYNPPAPNQTFSHDTN